MGKSEINILLAISLIAISLNILFLWVGGNFEYLIEFSGIIIVIIGILTFKNSHKMIGIIILLVGVLQSIEKVIADSFSYVVYVPVITIILGAILFMSEPKVKTKTIAIHTKDGRRLKAGTEEFENALKYT
jgi:hypothetical protein